LTPSDISSYSRFFNLLAMKTKQLNAFTLIEMLVVISIIAVLAAFAVPALTSALARGQMTGTLSNTHQLHLAAQQMALDGASSSDATSAWPGDIAPAITTLEAYVQALVTGDYLKAGDVQKLFSAPGVVCTVAVDNTTTPPTVTFASGSKSALKIYKVKDNDSSNTIFTATTNYTYNSAITAAGVPFGDKGFIVQRKGGDAGILRKSQATGTGTAIQGTVGKLAGDADGTASTGDTGADSRVPLTNP
jgi:prepilin-type N-terminal cleavage/methylation domain-containing protein